MAIRKSDETFCGEWDITSFPLSRLHALVQAAVDDPDVVYEYPLPRDAGAPIEEYLCLCLDFDTYNYFVSCSAVPDCASKADLDQ